MEPAPGDVSHLLQAWGEGDVRAGEDLVPIMYRELRKRAAIYLRGERREHTLQPTALVNEAYMRLVGQNRLTWQNRAHFFGVAAQMMRRVLLDHARERRAAKRSLLRTGGMPFETAYGISLRRFPQAAGYERAKIIPNLGLFGRPVREGTVAPRGINRIVLDRVEYGIRFGPVGFDREPWRPEDFSEEPSEA